MAEAMKVLSHFAENPGIAILVVLIVIWLDWRTKTRNGQGPPTSSQHERLLDKLDKLIVAVAEVETNRALNYPAEMFKQQVKDSADSARILREDVRPKIESIDDRTRDIHGMVLAMVGKEWR